MVVKEPEFEDANAIHRWNWLKEDFLQKKLLSKPFQSS